ncbi:deaminase domain-containing protein [Pseudomonas alvandae]|uniref:deaminase domain-containing protein n=1 Tax=Pseudomonas canavaninivorans TaxID=2842348 RepID=UPI003D6536B2
MPLDQTCNIHSLTGEVAKRPALGTDIGGKSWAPWFADVLVEPVSIRGHEVFYKQGKIYEVKNGKYAPYKGKPEWIGLSKKTVKPKSIVDVTIEFQTGIYAGIKITGIAEDINDIRRVGAITVPDLNPDFNYIFAKLDDKYYVLRNLAKNKSETLKLRQLESSELAEGYGEELKRIYEGSLNANNTVRLHGEELVNQALERLEKVSIPIGTTANPPRNMDWAQVDTSPAEALMFDQRTRLLVCEMPAGTALWSPVHLSPQNIQNKTTSIFGDIFKKRELSIEHAMGELKKILPGSQKNIAFAEVTLTSGRVEIYVSVSGINDYTRHLPVFREGNQLQIGDVTYYNVDALKGGTDPTSLLLTKEGESLLAIPHPTAGSSQTMNPITSGDSESKLISYISEKYPDNGDIRSITIATTLPPCDSCAIVMKEFGHLRGADALNVTWGKRKRPTNS